MMTLKTGQYHGKLLGQEEVSGVILTETVYEPNSKIPTHEHKNPYLCLAVSGEFDEDCFGKRVEVTPSTLIFHPAQKSHANQFDSQGGQCFNIEFTPISLKKHGIQASSVANMHESSFGSISHTAIKLYREFRHPDQFSALAMESLLLETLVSMAREKQLAGRQTPAWLSQAIVFVKERFATTLSLHDVADEVGVEPAKLARAFRQKMNCSLTDFMRRVRVEFVCHKLAQGDQSIGEIALEAGFYDQSHMTRSFRREMGITPSAYRQTYLLD